MELTPKLGYLYEYLKESLLEVPEDTILLNLLVMLSRIGGINRIHARYRGEIPSNVYALVFMPSGTGKDRTFNFINNNLFKGFIAKHLHLEESYKEKRRLDLILKAKEELGEDAKDRDIEKFIKENPYRSLKLMTGDGTKEGFESDREAFFEAGFGATFVVINEFASYILSDNQVRKEFLDAMKDVYEQGNSINKTIKNEFKSIIVEGVPNNVLFQSTPEGLLEGVGAKKMMLFLNQGLARRSFFCMPEIVEPRKEFNNWREEEEHYENLEEHKKACWTIIDDMLNTHKARNGYLLSDEAKDLLFNYKKECKYKTNVIEGISAELTSRPRKAIKLATLIAFIESPEECVISHEHLQTAVNIVDHYGKYLEKFIASINEDPAIKAWGYFKQHEGKSIKIMDLREARFVPWNNFKKWWSDNKQYLFQLALTQGYDLQELKTGSIGYEYLLTKIK